jgi:hypothetical protein
MPLYDFRCENEECSHYNQTVELLHRAEEITHQVLCDHCLNPMNKLVSAPYGRVTGGATNNHKINRKKKLKE